MAGRLARLAGAAAFAAALAAAAPAAGQDAPAREGDCDPEVERALAASAEAGAREDFRAVRHAEMGIRDPESIFDLSCVSRMFDYAHSNILFDPGRAMSDIVGLLNRLICDRARETFGRYVGRSLDARIFAPELERLPGLDIATERGNVLDEIERGRPSPEPPAPGVAPASSPATVPVPSRRPSRTELFRDLLGGN
ncbi:MAG: hypothetical protein OXM60_07670 [Defluviicoccus sp.]|nr:hypothetical protein [Defluviicoccus sp.]